MNASTTYKHKAQKLVLVSVAVICMWSLAGHALWTIARQACYQYVHHVQAQEKFNDTLIIPHKAPKASETVIWLNEHELQYAGKMFDVKQKLYTTSSTILIGQYDNIENDLFELLKKLVDDNEPADEESNEIVALTAILPCFKDDLIALSIMKERHNNPWKNSFHYSIALPPLHYPPDRIV